VKEFDGWSPHKLLHLPDEPAGVVHSDLLLLSRELLHLPDKPAGVGVESSTGY